MSAGGRPDRWGVRVSLPLAGDSGDIQACALAVQRASMELERAKEELACVCLAAYFERRQHVEAIQVKVQARYDDNGLPLDDGAECQVLWVDDSEDERCGGSLGGGDFDFAQAMDDDIRDLEGIAGPWAAELEKGGLISREGALMEISARILGTRQGDWLARVQARELDRTSQPGKPGSGSALRV